MSTCDFFGTNNRFACKAEAELVAVCNDHGKAETHHVCVNHYVDLCDMVAGSAGFRILETRVVEK